MTHKSVELPVRIEPKVNPTTLVPGTSLQEPPAGLSLLLILSVEAAGQWLPVA